MVIYHIPQISATLELPFFDGLALFHRGPEAVLVFFSLSGYLIIGQLFKEKSTTGFINIKNFYVRRMLRLYPVYYLVLGFGLFFYKFLLPQLGIAYEADYSISELLGWNVFFLPNVFKAL